MLVTLLSLATFAADTSTTAELAVGELSADDAAPIINGAAATRDEFPMAGALLMDADVQLGSYYDGPVRAFVCSSTLIAPDVVLLAAHCVDPEALNYMMTFGYGTTENIVFHWTREPDLTAFDGSSIPEYPADAVLAREAVFHPDFDLMSMQMGLAENHDIALLFLDTPVTDVPFAYLPTVEEAVQIVQDAQVEVVGWGMQEASENQWEAPEAGTYAEKMQGVSYIASLAETEMQIGLVEEDVRKCHGDSGGPTFFHVTTDSTESLRVIGVTSHAYDASDCSETGGVDTRVDAYLEWIDAEMTARCEDGSRAWCDEAGIPALPMPAAADEVTDEGEAPRGGCGCDVGGVGGAWIGLVGILGVRIRRRS